MAGVRELSLAEVFQLGYYWETKILLTAVKLDVFSALDRKSRSVEDVAQKVGADARALSLLMNALVSTGLLTKEADRYSNTTVAQSYLVRSEAEFVGHLLLLHDAEWGNWAKLEETVRTGCAPVTRHIFETDSELGANVLAVLHRIGKQSGPGFAQRLHLGEAETLLDLGGGAGTNAMAFCSVYPALQATVFDLPQTLTIAERTVKEAGFDQRVALKAGDFNRDGLGGPYDVILMSDILHYQDGPGNAALVAKTLTHLTPGGRLIIKDRFLDPSRTSPAWTTAFAVHILVNTEHGACFTTAEALDWMNRAGFQSPSELEPCAVVQGTTSREA